MKRSYCQYNNNNQCDGTNAHYHVHYYSFVIRKIKFVQKIAHRIYTSNFQREWNLMPICNINFSVVFTCSISLRWLNNEKSKCETSIYTWLPNGFMFRISIFWWWFTLPIFYFNFHRYKLCCKSSHFQHLSAKKFNSKYFGTVFKGLKSENLYNVIALKLLVGLKWPLVSLERY